MLPVEVEVVVIPGELLHEMDGEGAEDGEEDDAQGVEEIVNAVDVLLHQDARALQLIMFLFVCLHVNLTLLLEFL